MRRDDAFLTTLTRVGAIRGERMTQALMLSLFRGIDFAGRRVLDIGGGEGIYSFYAAAMGASEVVCLEPEAEGSVGGDTRTFQRIRQCMPQLPVRLVERRVNDYHDDDGFDVVAMIASINHLDEQACERLLDHPAARAAYRQVFARIASLTKPGGRLIIADCTRYNFFAALGLKNPLCPTIEWEKHQTPDTWASLLLSAGFCKPRITWEPLYRFGPAVQALLSNKLAAWFLKSCFRLEMERCS
ncbi:MAG TPA: class I SAM-dependent methyltransferase [Burkholderiales bacterium]|nr:class I SAM-dependent methyltransferase [Burkholderiales bacterium]